MALWLAVVLIIGFTLLSGFNDGGNLLATFLNTRTMNRIAVFCIIILTIVLAPFLTGTAVANTIGTQIIDVRKVGIATLNVALIATLGVLFIAWRVKLPTSTSFALVGGMMGAGMVLLGPGAIVWSGVLKSVASLILAVLLGWACGYAVHSLLIVILRRLSLRSGVRAGNLQYLSSALVCIGYGGNDAEKSIGLLATVYVLATHGTTFTVQWWMVVLSTSVFGVGLLWGGWRVAKTIGCHVFLVRPVHSLSTQISTACVVLTAAALGGPVSTTQTIDSALIGVGTRFSKQRIRWDVVRKLMVVWFVTMPMAFVLAALMAFIFKVGNGT